MPSSPVHPFVRFLGRIVLSASGCWDFSGASDKDGYKEFWLHRDSYRANRLSYALANSDLSGELTVDHLCDNRQCVNPFHLEQKSAIDNVRRGHRHHANTAKTHCKQGHEYTTENTYLRQRTGGRLARDCRTCQK